MTYLLKLIKLVTSDTDTCGINNLTKDKNMKQTRLEVAIESIINGQHKQAREQLKKVSRKTILNADIDQDLKLKLLTYKEKK